MWVAVMLLWCMAGFSSLASADSFSWNLTGTNSPANVPCSLAVPCAEVTLSVSGNNAMFTVTSLLNGYVFDTFGFNTIPGVNVSLVSAGGEIGNYSLGGPGNQDGWGKFQYIFDTGKNGGSSGGDCVNHGAGCTFDFQLTSLSNLTLAYFEVLSSGGNGSGFFAGHLAANGGLSGFVGNPKPVPVNEPGPMAAWVPGLLVGAVFLGRRVLL